MMMGKIRQYMIMKTIEVIALIEIFQITVRGVIGHEDTKPVGMNEKINISNLLFN